jgi:hypothetical protein
VTDRQSHSLATSLVLRQQRDRRANLTRGAISALRSIMAHKRSLHWMEITVIFKPSMVVILSPACITASVKQLLMRCPLTITVQAPHTRLKNSTVSSSVGNRSSCR